MIHPDDLKELIDTIAFIALGALTFFFVYISGGM